jgi:hypothetical protein
MSAPTARTRLLLLGLAVAVMLGLLYWPETEERSWAPNPNHVRTAPGPQANRAGAEQRFAPPVDRARSDSDFANHGLGFGMLLMERDQTADTGSFYYVDLRDSTRTLPSLGFIAQSTLLDSAARFAALAEAGPPGEIAVASRAAVDAALHSPGSDCIVELAIPVRHLSGGSSRWKVALMPGAEAALPTGEWRTWRATTADREEALHLAHLLPAAAPPAREDAQPLDSVRVPGTFALESLHQFRIGSTDYLVADVRVQYTEPPKGSTAADQLFEQRLFIAEREASSGPVPFGIAWSRQEAAWSDEPATESPVMMLRLGAERLLTLYTSGHYKDGGGGLFISRVGKQQWRTVASWYAGC